MHKRKEHFYYKSLLLILICCVIQPNLYANKVKKLRLSNYSGYSNAPLLKVYSVDGESWSEVDENHTSMVQASLYARCKYEGKGNKAYKGRFTVDGFAPVGDVLPANYLIPHSQDTRGVFKFVGGVDFNPVKACNDELAKKVALKPDLKLDKKFRKYPYLRDGFKVNLPASIKSSYRLTCNPIAGGFGDFKFKTTMLNAVVDCQGSELAAEKVPKKPVEIKVAKLVPMVSKVSFEPSPAKHVGTCPTGVSFKGSITASRAGEVKYQYAAKDGGKSPIFTMNFAKAGTQATGNWHETVSKPDKTKSFLSVDGKKGPDVSSWWRLKVVSPESAKSATAKYSVYCQDKPTPSRKRTRQ